METPITPAAFVERFAEAEAVFLGKVSEIEYRIWDTGSTEESELNTKVTVIESFKGVAANAEIILGNYHQSSCEANMRVRDTYLIFAYRAQPDDGRLHVSMCSLFLYESSRQAETDNNIRLKLDLEPILESMRRRK